MSSQEDPQGSPSGDKWNWEDQSVDDQVFTTLSVSPSMTEKQYKSAKDKDSAKAAHFKTASIPKSLRHPHRNRKKKILGTMTGLSPSGSCPHQLLFDLKYPNGEHKTTSEYYPSPLSKHSLNLGSACDSIATGLAAQTESAKVRSLMLSGITAGVARSLFDEQRNLVMTYLLELRLAKKQSDSSTRTSTIPPVQAEDEEDTDTANSDDADWEIDDHKYAPGYVDDPKADPGDESEDDAQAASEEEI